MTQAGSILLFLYGTLKRGDVRAWAMAGQTFLGEAITQPIYAIHDCGDYPALVAVATGGEPIRGELWEASAAASRLLDDVEGSAQGWFVRGPIQLAPPHDDLAVQTYYYGGDVAGLPRLPGVWTARRSSSPHDRRPD